MATLNRPTVATYTLHESVTIDTSDREDHTFCGIAFPIQCKSILPIEHVVINSVSVRGALGPLTVWVTKRDDNDNDHAETGTVQRRSNSQRSMRYNLRNHLHGHGANVRRGQMVMKEQYWEKVYDRAHRPSFQQFQELHFGSNPIIIKPGEIRGIYVHSTIESDRGIVYDNQQKIKTYDDQFLTVLPGRAHVSPRVFGAQPIWGWGNAWRDSREFVGRISFGVVYKLWNPSENLKFGGKFQTLATVLFMCQRRWESPFSMLSDDAIFYILNMCRWDWVGDDYGDVRAARKKLRDAEEANANANENMEGAHDEENEDAEIDANGGEDEEGEDIGEEEEENGIPSQVDMEVEESSYDSDYANSDEDSEPDDGYDDHRGSSAFQYNYYDDYGSSDEEREAEELRRRQDLRRLNWLRHHFGHRFVRVHVGSEDSVEEEES